MELEYEIHCFNDLIGFARVAGNRLNDIQPWFRGLSLDEHKLVAAVHRPPHNEPHREGVYIKTFRAMAQTRSADCPDFSDLSGWLSLARHHGLPTRLLDWTRSVFIAAFFAVNGSDPSLPSVVWAFDPMAMNRAIADIGYVPLFHHRNDDAGEAIQRAYDGTGPTTCPPVLAVTASQNSLRMMVQAAAFTIHDTPTPMEELPNANRFLCGARIMAAAKVEISNGLRFAGIDMSTLFPDLDHLAAWIPAHPWSFRRFEPPRRD